MRGFDNVAQLVSRQTILLASLMGKLIITDLTLRRVHEVNKKMM